MPSGPEQPEVPDLLSRELRRSFRDQLRTARARAQADSENFMQIIHVFERLGATVYRGGDRNPGLNAYKDCFLELCISSNVNDFERLFELVREERNEAVHRGHAARSLTRHAIRLAVLMEENLMAGRSTVEEYMIESPVCADLWQQVAYIRRLMLENSFSFLPICVEKGWLLLSDDALVTHLRKCEEPERRRRLNETIGDALPALRNLLIEPATFRKTDSVEHLLSSREDQIGRPALVVEDGHLFGIVTAEDLL